MKTIAMWAVIKYYNFAQVWLNRAEVLNIRAVPEGTMLPVISAREVFPLLFKPVNDGICVLLDRGGENNKVIPFTYFSKKVVAMRSFMYVVKDWMLRTEFGPSVANSVIEFNFHHVATAHSTAH